MNKTSMCISIVLYNCVKWEAVKFVQVYKIAQGCKIARVDKIAQK